MTRGVPAGARYEVANNSIARGIILMLANDMIGTGPRRVFTRPGALLQKGPSGEPTGLSAYEADGSRTRNHRIDSPVL